MSIHVMAVDAFCVVFVGSGSLFCVTKQPGADSFKCNHLNGAHCVATLVVLSWYRAIETR